MLKTIIPYIYLLAAGQGVFLSMIILFPNRFRNRSVLALTALLTILFSYNLLYYFLAYSGLMVQVPHLFMTHGSLILLYGPILFLMFRLMSNEAFELRWQHLLHAIPFSAFLIAFMPMFLLPADVKLQIYERDMATDGLYPFSWQNLLINLALTGHLISYIVLTHRSAKQSFFRFPRALLWLPATFAGLYTFYQTIHFLGVPYSSYLCYGVKLCLGVTVYWLSYLVFMKNGTLEPAPEKKKYQTSGLDSRTAKILSEKILLALVENELFLDANLNLKQLAEILKIPSHYVSQAINEHLQMSFPDLLNKYRIEHAKKLLTETDEKIISVGYRSGFNNKVSFLNAFRRHTASTPLAYRTSMTTEKE